MNVIYAKQNEKLPRRFWAVIACFLTSLLFLLFQGGKLAAMTFIIVCILCLYITLGKWSGIARAKGSRTIANGEQETLEAGTALTVKIDVQIPGFWPVPYVFVKDRLMHRHLGATLFETTLIPDWTRKGSVEYRTQPLRRGFYSFARTECSTEDIFGIFEHKGRLDLPLSFKVLPQTVRIGDWKQLNQMQKGTHHHSTTTRAIRETTQINGVREYTYGDRMSRIHWNATARTGTWKSKEFEKESLPKTIIVLDREQGRYESSEQFELAVSIAASLFEYGKKKGLSLGLLSAGKDAAFFDAAAQPSHYTKIANHLVDVEADGSHSLYQVLSDRANAFVPGTFIVMVSPHKGEAALSALGWIRQRHMNASHILAGTATGEDQSAWTKLLQSKGCAGYAVPELQELPKALGGRNG